MKLLSISVASHRNGEQLSGIQQHVFNLSFTQETVGSSYCVQIERITNNPEYLCYETVVQQRVFSQRFL